MGRDVPAYVEEIKDLAQSAYVMLSVEKESLVWDDLWQGASTREPNSRL